MAVAKSPTPAPLSKSGSVKHTAPPAEEEDSGTYTCPILTAIFFSFLTVLFELLGAAAFSWVYVLCDGVTKGYEVGFRFYSNKWCVQVDVSTAPNITEGRACYAYEPRDPNGTIVGNLIPFLDEGTDPVDFLDDNGYSFEVVTGFGAMAAMFAFLFIFFTACHIEPSSSPRTKYLAPCSYVCAFLSIILLLVPLGSGFDSRAGDDAEYNSLCNEPEPGAGSILAMFALISQFFCCLVLMCLFTGYAMKKMQEEEDGEEEE